MRRWKLLAMSVFTAASLMVGAGGSAVHASQGLPNFVSANPADYTPQISDEGIAQCGTGFSCATVEGAAKLNTTWYAGGLFHYVTDRNNTKYARENLFAFDALSGNVLPLSLQLDGQVNAVYADTNGVYVGGEFKTVNGLARRGLFRINPTTNQVDPAFNAKLNGSVNDITVIKADTGITIGGDFTTVGTAGRVAIANVAFADGAVGQTVNLGFSGVNSGTTGRSSVYRIAHTDSYMAVIGNFTTVSGTHPRRGFTMYKLGDMSLSSFYSDLMNGVCSSNTPAYFRGVDFSPDGSKLLLGSTGGWGHPGRLCDTASLWTVAENFSSNPLWINDTGGDTIFAVAHAGNTIYVGGHFRWLDNTGGTDSCANAAICKPRPGIASIDPVTGKATAWNPMRSREIGTRRLIVSTMNGTAGLWVFSDGGKLGCSNPNGYDCTGQPLENHNGIGYLPLN